MRAKRAIIEEYNIPTRNVLPYRTPSIPSWTLQLTIPDLSMREVVSRQMAPTVNFINLITEKYRNYREQSIPTAQSLIAVWVQQRYVRDDRVMKVSLPEIASIYSAAVHAISLACTLIETQDSGGNSYIICSDSLSCIQAYKTSPPKIMQ